MHSSRSGGLTKIKHSSHSGHFLLLKAPQEPYKCEGCKEVGFGPCYECEHEDCGFYLHEECAIDIPSYSIVKCSLKFHHKAPQGGDRFCYACGRAVLGFVYQCTTDKNPRDYHPSCLKLERTFTAEDGTTLHLKEETPSECLYCRRRKTPSGIEGWSYVYSCGQYCLHVACMKGMLWESWKKVFFLKEGKMSKDGALQISIPNKDVALPSGRRSVRGKQIWKMAKAAVRLIISAFVGDPTALIIEVFQLLSN
ncbi:hypothetical protein OIU76_012368 [Salix suchowensis]|nr:hypothetical protein OIU76_012368 [Salix suchowensis]